VAAEETGNTLSGTFIIDHQGYIHGMELLTNPIGRCTDEILRELKAFQNYVSTGEMVPCDWHPGGKTIAPSLDMYGNMSNQWKPQQGR
jgi:peroxiredoxin (alkyl hydroperoxide reductase subunit C)